MKGGAKDTLPLAIVSEDPLLDIPEPWIGDLWAPEVKCRQFENLRVYVQEIDNIIDLIGIKNTSCPSLNPKTRPKRKHASYKSYKPFILHDAKMSA